MIEQKNDKMVEEIVNALTYCKEEDNTLCDLLPIDDEQ